MTAEALHHRVSRINVADFTYVRSASPMVGLSVRNVYGMDRISKYNNGIPHGKKGA